MTSPRIYLAGPEVFLPDSLEMGAKKVALCTERRFEGVFPLDASLDLTGLAKQELALRISAVNEGPMRSCDLLIADLTRSAAAPVPYAGASGCARLHP